MNFFEFAWFFSQYTGRKKSAHITNYGLVCLLFFNGKKRGDGGGMLQAEAPED
jgi:hypothetical protein